MQSAAFGDHYVIRLDEGEEVVERMLAWLTENHVQAGYFLAWGGFSRLKLKYYRVEERDYKERQLDQQVEVVSLLGNIALSDNGPIIHAHTTVGDDEFHTYSGHLAEGVVRPLLEIFVTPFPGQLWRVHDSKSNLDLLDLSRQR